ncbi:MAG: LAGLIDADG family homing endonuclease, partial [archaeon]|nr:LAGLIDADG family homing endonuclease [archaeon]
KKIKGRKFSLVNLHFSKKDELGEFLGIFSGDGCFCKRPNSHYIIRIYVGYYEKHYADYLGHKFYEWFGKKPNIYISYYRGKKSMITLYYSSKIIYEHIKKYLSWEGKKSYTIRLKSLDLNNRMFNIGFVRGLIDTDGSYYAPKRRVSFSTVSKELSKQVMAIIENLIKIKPKCYILHPRGEHELYTITLHGENAKKLIRLVKPQNINKGIAAII